MITQTNPARLLQAPQKASHYGNLGAWHLEKWNFTEGIVNLRMALSLRETDVRKRNADVYNLGVALFKNGEYDEALKVLSKVDSNVLKNSKVEFYIGMTLLALGYTEHAEWAFQAEIKKKDTPRVRYNIGVAFEKSGEHQKASEQFRRALLTMFEPPLRV